MIILSPRLHFLHSLSGFLCRYADKHTEVPIEKCHLHPANEAGEGSTPTWDGRQHQGAMGGLAGEDADWEDLGDQAGLAGDHFLPGIFWV